MIRYLLILLTIAWLAYRLTPLNATVNDYLEQKGLSVQGSIFDTSTVELQSPLTGSNEYGSSDAGADASAAMQQLALTFLPAVVLIGIIMMM